MDANETLGILGDKIDTNFTLPITDPIFWELILVLFLVSLRFWRIKRSAVFVVILTVLVLATPFLAILLSKYLLSMGIVFDAELMRVFAVFLIALLFYLYITKWK